MSLIKVNEKEICQILAKHYGVRSDDICLLTDYQFVLRGGDKVRENFVYAIVDTANRDAGEKS